MWLKQKGHILVPVTEKSRDRTGLEYVWIQSSGNVIRMKFSYITQLCLYLVDFILSDLSPARRNFHNHLQNSFGILLSQTGSCAHAKHCGLGKAKL